MSVEPPRGRFVWYDLVTTDPVGAESFYTRLIGWGTTDFEGSEKPYKMWTQDDVPLGGLMQLPPEAKEAGAPPHWLAYISVPDVDATVAQAQELGATVHVPGTDIPTAGRFAVLGDPQGATFAVHRSENPLEEEAAPGRRPISWNELMSGDWQASFAFYGELFGWQKLEQMDMGGGNIYQMYGRSESRPLGGMYNKPADWQGPPAAWLFYISVGDVTAAVERVRELGGTLLNGPMEVPGGDLVAQCLDPQGGAFALHSAAPAADA